MKKRNKKCCFFDEKISKKALGNKEFRKKEF